MDHNPFPGTLAVDQPSIYFFEEDIQFALPRPQRTIDWLTSIIRREGYQLVKLNYIFCSDQYLHTKNVAYLQHDTLTDVITLDHIDASSTRLIEGDIYISVERVQENAAAYQCTHMQELHRVMAHGLLHLLGYDDRELEAKEKMRQKEKECLDILASDP